MGKKAGSLTGFGGALASQAPCLRRRGARALFLAHRLSLLRCVEHCCGAQCVGSRLWDASLRHTLRARQCARTRQLLLHR